MLSLRANSGCAGMAGRLQGLTVSRPDARHALGRWWQVHEPPVINFHRQNDIGIFRVHEVQKAVYETIGTAISQYNIIER